MEQRQQGEVGMQFARSERRAASLYRVCQWWVCQHCHVNNSLFSVNNYCLSWTLHLQWMNNTIYYTDVTEPVNEVTCYCFLMVTEVYNCVYSTDYVIRRLWMPLCMYLTGAEVQLYKLEYYQMQGNQCRNSWCISNLHGQYDSVNIAVTVLSTLHIILKW